MITCLSSTHRSYDTGHSPDMKSGQQQTRQRYKDKSSGRMETMGVKSGQGQYFLSLVEASPPVGYAVMAE